MPRITPTLPLLLAKDRTWTRAQAAVSQGIAIQIMPCRIPVGLEQTPDQPGFVLQASGAAFGRAGLNLAAVLRPTSQGRDLCIQPQEMCMAVCIVYIPPPCVHTSVPWVLHPSWGGRGGPLLFTLLSSSCLESPTCGLSARRSPVVLVTCCARQRLEFEPRAHVKKSEASQVWRCTL